MKPIATSKGLLLGLAAALLVGLLASAAQTTVEGEPDASPMALPSARVGDEVLYVWYVDQDAVDAKGSAEADGPRGGLGTQKPQPMTTVEAPSAEGYVITRAQAFRLDAVTQTADGAGVVHDVVLVRQADMTGSTAQTSYQYVDLAMRDAIRHDVHDEMGEGTEMGRATFAILEPDLPGARLQAHTIALGQDLAGLFPARDASPAFVGVAAMTTDSSRASEILLPDPFGGRTLPGTTTTASVVDRALVDGQDAYAVRHAATIPLQSLVDATGWVPPDADTTGHVRISRTYWVTTASAYPVLIEANGEYDTKDGPVTFEDARIVLAQTTDGTGPAVPWGEDRADQHYLDRNDDLERTSGSQAYPADGTGSRLPYPLAQALSEVQADPTLVQFRTWSLQNPDAVLVSATTQPGQGSTPGIGAQLWDFVFALPSGEGYEVSIQRAAGAPRGAARDLGAVAVTPFQVADLPSTPVTLAAAERVWASVAGPDFRSEAPNFVQWGLPVSLRGAGARVAPSYANPENVAAALHQLDVGHMDPSGALSAASDYVVSLVTLDAESGLLAGGWEYREEFDWTNPPNAGSKGLSFPQSQRMITGFQPPTIERAAVASTSLMAVFLALYFLPLLKFVGAKALLLVPGYSKLAKDSILDNRVREQLLDTIKSNPGIHASDLARRVDAGWGTVVYHLSILEKNKMVSSLVDGRHKRFFPVGLVDFGKRGQLAVLMNPTSKQLFALIQETPGIITGELSKHIGVTLPSTMWHLRRLEDAGLVGRAKRGRKVHYYANEGASGEPDKPYDPGTAVEVA